jgi:hypothetical protein
MVLPHESRHYAAPPSGGAPDVPQGQPPGGYARNLTPPATDTVCRAAAAGGVRFMGSLGGGVK